MKNKSHHVTSIFLDTSREWIRLTNRELVFDPDTLTRQAARKLIQEESDDRDGCSLGESESRDE